MRKILIVEDDILIAEIERDYLEIEDFEVTICQDGQEGLKLALDNEYDLILLDVMLPGVNGFTICREIRKQKDVAVIMVTAKKEDLDKIRGLGLGADDYIVKPFDLEELGARVAAHLRRETRIKKQNILRFFGEMSIDYSGHQLQIGENPIVLSRTEFAIVELLSLNAGQVFDRERIYESVWGLEGAGSSDTVMEHIRKIRAKLSAYTDHNYIETVWGIGYKWNG